MTLTPLDLVGEPNDGALSSIFILRNEYRIDNGAVTTSWRRSEEAEVEVTTEHIGDGRCQKVESYTEVEEQSQWVIYLQKWELWATDVAVKELIDLGHPSTGKAGLSAGSTLTGASLLAGASEAGAAAAAVGAAGMAFAGLAFGLAVYSGTTALGEELGLLNPTEKVDENWQPVAKYRHVKSTGRTRTNKERVGEPFDCPDHESESGEGDEEKTGSGSGRDEQKHASGANVLPQWTWPLVAIATLLLLGGLWIGFGSSGSGDGGDSSPQQGSAAPSTDAPDQDSGEADSEPSGVGAGEEPTGADITVSTVIDETGDQQRQADDLPDVDESRERDGVSAADVLNSTDVVLMEVTTTASTSTTEMALTFNGEAQEVIGLRGVSLSAGIQMFLADGRIVEIILKSDGTVKIVDTDRPAGTSVDAEWISPHLLLFTLTGFVPDPGTEITARIFLEVYQGYVSDVVTLLTSAG
ncbi:MAG: hypothetical protein GY720_18170 [bacterium]|nr:hypothetical protein [bacterium]